MAKKKSTRPTRRKDDRPDEIVEAALDVFVEKGFAESKIVDIAKRANAAKGTVYLYFDTKEQLFEAVVRHYIKPTHHDIIELSKAFPGSSSELLGMIIHRFYQEMADNHQRRGLMRILIAEGHRFPQLTKFYYEEFISKAEQMFMQVVKRGVKSGEFRKSPLGKTPKVMMGPAIMAAIWKMSFENVAPIDLKKFADAHVDMLLHSLKKT